MKEQKKIGFLFYDNRSGSTLLANLLDKFDQIGVTIESTALLDILVQNSRYESENDVSRQVKKLYRDIKFPHWMLDEATLGKELVQQLPFSSTELFRHLLSRYFEKNKPSAEIFIYKVGSPIYQNVIHSHFPNAKWIYIYRDGRAVFCSKKRAVTVGTHSETMDNNPIHAAKYWKKLEESIYKNHEKFDTFQVQYEALVKDYRSVLQKTAAYLLPGRTYDIAVLEKQSRYSQKIPSNQIHLHGNLKKEPMHSRIDAWRKEISYEELYFFEKIAARSLQARGYELLTKAGAQDFRQSFALFAFHMRLMRKSVQYYLARFLYFLRDQDALTRKLKTIFS